MTGSTNTSLLLTIWLLTALSVAGYDAVDWIDAVAGSRPPCTPLHSVMPQTSSGEVRENRGPLSVASGLETFAFDSASCLSSSKLPDDHCQSIAPSVTLSGAEVITRSLQSSGRHVLQAIALRHVSKDLEATAQLDVAVELLLAVPIAASFANGDLPAARSKSRSATRALIKLGERVGRAMAAEGRDISGVELGDDVSVALPAAPSRSAGNIAGDESPAAQLDAMIAERVTAGKLRGSSDDVLSGPEWLDIGRQLKATVIVRDADGRDPSLFLCSLVLKYVASIGGSGGGGTLDVGVSLYFTPAGAVSTVPPHVDSMDVVALHLAGSKRWSIHPGAPLVQRPLRDIPKLRPSHYSKAAATAEVTLVAGDVLYIPRGAIHNASSVTGSDSLCSANPQHGTINDSVHASIGFDPAPHATVAALIAWSLKQQQQQQEQSHRVALQLPDVCFSSTELAIVLVNSLAQKLLPLRAAVQVEFADETSRVAFPSPLLHSKILDRVGVCGENADPQRFCQSAGFDDSMEWCLEQAAETCALLSAARQRDVHDESESVFAQQHLLTAAFDALRRALLRADGELSDVAWDLAREASSYERLMASADEWFATYGVRSPLLDRRACEGLTLSRIVAQAVPQLEADVARRNVDGLVAKAVHLTLQPAIARGSTFVEHLWSKWASDRPGYYKWVGLNAALLATD